MIEPAMQNLTPVVNQSNVPMVRIQKECPLCQSSRLRPFRTERNRLSDHSSPYVRLYDGTWIQMLVCLDCAFAFTKELPPDRFFAERYDIRFDPAFESKNPFKDRILAGIFSDLKTRGRVNGRWLDIGSFAGVLLKQARNKGFQVEGVEVNPTVADYTRTALGFDVRQGMFLEQKFEDRRFDVISLIDVLEHLCQPREVLENCARIIKPGGQIVIKVPHYKPQLFKQQIAGLLRLSDMGIFENFAHINHFSPRSLGLALERLGFANIEASVSRSEVFAEDRMSNKLKNSVRHLVYMASEGTRKLTGINLGLNIIVIANKTK